MTLEDSATYQYLVNRGARVDFPTNGGRLESGANSDHEEI